LRGETRKDVYADIRSPEAEIESVGRVVAALRNSTAPKANICHTTTEGALGLVEQATRGGMSMHCEAALLHLFYNRKALLQNPLLKTNPPLRSEEDREALVRSLNGGIVSFLVTDHAPHALDEKESEGLSGVPGLDDYSHVVSWLIRGQEVEPSAIGKVASANPAKFAGLDDRGEIDVGKRADFTILDLHSPDRVKSDDVRSKCGWSPYEGVEFPGRARWTVSRGEVLMDDFELVT
jgi:dihydroorotase